MQIKRRGDKYQLLRYSGYSKDKKRATVEVVGLLSYVAREIPDDLAAKLTPAEVDQLTEFLKEKADDHASAMARMDLEHIAKSLSNAQSALERGVPVVDAEAIHKAIKSFQKAMKKAGYGPARGEPVQGRGAPGQQSFLTDQPAATTP